MLENTILISDLQLKHTEITTTTMNNSYSNLWYGTEVGYMYVAWYKILHISYQVHKLDKKIVSEYDQEIPQSQTADNPVAPRGRAARTENEAGEAKGAITYSFCSKNNLKKTNVMLIDRWLRMGLLPPPREFRRHILSCRELKAESFKRCLHSVLRGVSL